MQFRKLRYNLTISMLVILMIALVGFTSFALSNSDTQVPGEELPENPGLVPDEETPPEGVEIPSIRSPMKLLIFSLDMVYNGKGYKSTLQQKVVTTAIINVTQNIKTFKQKSGDKLLEQIYTKTDSFGVNYYKYAMYDRKTESVESLLSENYSYENETFNASGLSPKSESKENFLTTNFLLPAQFPLTINSSNTKIVGTKIESKYYEIKASFSKDMLPSEYINYFYAQSNGQISPNSLSYTKDVSLVFRISKTTGKLMQYIKNEEFNVRPSMMPSMTARMTSSSTETFSVMDQAFDITRPAY